MSSKGKRLTPDQIDEIVRLRLNGIPVREVAARLDVTTRTVQKHYHAYLDARAEERRAEIDRVRARRVARLDNAADDARRAFMRALRDGDLAAASRLLAEERQALLAAARVDGLERIAVEHEGAVGIGPVSIELVTDDQVTNEEDSK